MDTREIGNDRLVERGNGEGVGRWRPGMKGAVEGATGARGE